MTIMATDIETGIYLKQMDTNLELRRAQEEHKKRSVLWDEAMKARLEERIRACSVGSEQALMNSTVMTGVSLR